MFEAGLDIFARLARLQKDMGKTLKAPGRDAESLARTVARRKGRAIGRFEDPSKVRLSRYGAPGVIARAGARAGSAGVRVGKKVVLGGARGGARSFNFAKIHPSAVVIPAALIGAASAHPFRKSAAAVSNAIYDNPDVIHNAVMGTAAYGVFGNYAYGQRPGYSFDVTSAGVTPGITTESPQYSVNPDVDDMLRSIERNSPNPTGNIVFGLHNNRLR